MVFAAAPEGSQASSSKMSEVLEQLKKIALKMRRVDSVVYEKLYCPPQEPKLEDIIKQFEERMDAKMEATFQILSQKMDTIVTEFDRKFELLLEAQINTVVQLKPPKPEDQPGPSHRGEKRKERRHDDVKQERAPKRPPVPEEVARAKERLDHLARCERRVFGNAPKLLVRDGRAVMCAFCEEVGKHEEDSCPNFRTVQARRNVVRNEDLCIFCVRRCEEKPCPRRKPCGYCKSQAHHMSICPLPEDRANLEAIIEEWNAHQGAAPECARNAH
ncbi:hypothetical protein Y032_0406g902 [Ancylostoma ceylanicum]|uniref:Uncharacterized protein n=1 Tax=Ancylostoma ceylanicum TaxID=53326 RepID=A0A016X4J9_9BILA|nr:hypothetical protein Y032_0406g902 [Ancylostoma ceylanicum]